MMKILRILILLFACMGALSPAIAGNGRPLLKNTFTSVELYYGIPPTAARAELALTVVTPRAVQYGVWRSSGMHKGQTLPLISWTGSDPAPTVVMNDFSNRAPRSSCKDLPSNWYGCGSFTLNITVQSDDYGCPWLATSHITSTDIFYPTEVYSPPDVRSSICPTVPVETFDISWEPNSVKHETVLRLEATGGTINRTLPTYLLQNGKLCDGSKFDTRGAYCRFVATGVTLNVLGCDQSAVSTTAVTHPITDTELHDINVSVNTKNIGSGQFSSTCSFQYIIDEL